MQHFSNTQWISLPAFLLFVQLVLCTLYCRLRQISSLIYSHDSLRSAAVRSSRSNTSAAGVAMPTRTWSHPATDPSWPLRTRSEVERNDDRWYLSDVTRCENVFSLCSATKIFIEWRYRWWHYFVFKRDPVRLLCGMNGVLPISKLISADHPRTYSLENKPAANWTYPIITRGYETTSLRASKNI